MKPALAILAVFMFAACANQSGKTVGSVPVYQNGSIPSGSAGDAIRYGRELIAHTRAHLGKYVTASMDCQACHLEAGTKPKGGSFVGIYGQFPQWNARAHRVIALQDRLAECFLYSMNGRPPAYNSREMVAMVAYIAYLSRGIPVGATPDPAVKLTKFTPPQPASSQRGAQLYSQRCASCHGADGAGTAVYPPLWGSRSFNTGAGMHRLWTMAAFIRANMPRNAPGTLSAQQAYDVSAFVLSHTRPKFQANRAVVFSARPAKYF